MTQFHYSIPPPESEPPASLSGLSEEARRALTEGAMGPSPADRLLAPTGNGVEELRPEVKNWAIDELVNYYERDALSSWQRYKDKLGVPVPKDILELKASNPNFTQTVNRLYEAKQALLASGETTPDGHNIGETMHLVLVPWQEMSNRQIDFIDWFMEMSIQLAPYRYSILPTLTDSIIQNKPLYRELSTASMVVPAHYYLSRKIEQDGPWGIILTQTNVNSGVKSMTNRSPNQLTNYGQENLAVAGQSVDHMGVFELVALVLQQDIGEQPRLNNTWLLANRLDVDGIPRVPSYYCKDDFLSMELFTADFSDKFVNTRLTVM